MIEVHLIGYTEDGSELVFDLDPDGEGRYALAVDPDLLATMAAVRQARVAHALPVDARPPARDTSASPVAAAGGADRDGPEPTGSVVQIRVDDPAAASATGGAAGPEPAADTGPDAPEQVEPEVAEDVEPEVAEEVEPGEPVPADPGTVDGPSTNGVTVPPRSALSPAEIQRRLRSGRSVSAVAEEAGVEAAWIERWLPPILAERDRVLADAWQRAVGDGSEPLLPQVEEALARRGAPRDRTVWSAARRADGRWRVSVRFPEDGRSRSATWTLRAEGGPLTPASPLAAELAPHAGRRRRR